MSSSKISVEDVLPSEARGNSTKEEVVEKADEKRMRPVMRIELINFLVLGFAVLIISIGYMLIDIFLSYAQPFNSNNDYGLQVTSWGVINRAIDFLMRLMICSRLYHGKLSAQTQMAYFAIGATLTILTDLIIRYPLYSMFREYSQMNTSTKLQTWARIIDPSGFQSAVAFVVLLRLFIFFYALPKAVHKFAAPVVSNVDKLKATLSRRTAESKSAVNYYMFAWLLVWHVSVIICEIAFSSTSSLESGTAQAAGAWMYVVLWVPFVFSAWMVYSDSKKKEEGQVIKYSLGYLILYLFLVERIPDYGGNILLIFNNLSTGQAIFRLFSALFYNGVFNFVYFMGRESLAMAGKPGAINIPLLFPLQFFQTFFDILFFAQLNLSNALFWIILFFQISALNFMHSVGITKLIFLLREKFTGKAITKEPEIRTPQEKVLDILQEKRLLRSEMQQIIQYAIVDAIAIFSLVASYYAVVAFEYANKGSRAALSYSIFFGVKNIEQITTAQLGIQFGIVFLCRLIGNICSFLYIKSLVKDLNERILQLGDKKELGSVNALDVEGQTAPITVLNVWKICVRHLDDNWWLFFTISCISVLRVGFAVRTVLFTVNANILEEYFKTLYGQDFVMGNSVPPFWFLNLARIVFG